jgi:hypothetical protein
VLEYSAMTPSLADDAARDDGEVWLDPLGAMRMRGKVPESLVPLWKRSQMTKRGALSGYLAAAGRLGGIAPFWAIIGGGILAVGLFIYMMWCCCCRKRRGGTGPGRNQEVFTMVLDHQDMMSPGYSPHRGAGGSYTTSTAAVAAGGRGGSRVRGKPQVVDEASHLSPGASGAQSDPSYSSSGTKTRQGSSYTNSGDPNGNQIPPWWGEEEAHRTVTPMSCGMSPAGMLRVNSPPSSRSGSPNPQGHQQQQQQQYGHGRSGARRGQLGDRGNTPSHSPRRSAWE